MFHALVEVQLERCEIVATSLKQHDAVDAALALCDKRSMVAARKMVDKLFSVIQQAVQSGYV